MRKRFISIVGFATLVAAMFLILPADPAAACTCAGDPEDVLVERADVIFTGRLLDRRNPDDNDGISSSGDFASLRFEVDAVYKGDAAIDQAVVTEQMGMSCGLELEGTGPFLVFAHHTHWGGAPVPEGMLHAGKCAGTRTVAAGLPPSLGSAREPTAPADGAEPATTAPALGAATDSGTNLGLVAGIVVGAGVLIGGTGAWFTTRRRTARSAT